MLTNLHKTQTPDTGVIRRPITEIECGLPPFKPGVVYCAPARGHWTIAHTPMLIPESYMIYLCASACMRGVVLSALEDGGMDRFSMVILNDKDIYEGNLEQVMIDGISEILDGLSRRPPIVMPFTSCIHHFLSCDTNYIYKKLRERFPDVDFVQCYMIPTIRRGHITPEELMQVNLYDALEPQDELDVRAVNFIGCNYAQDPENDCYRMLADAGYQIRDLPMTKTYREYKDMAKSCANIYTAPLARFSAHKLEHRLGQKDVYLPGEFTFAGIRRQLEKLSEMFSVRLPDLDAMQASAQEALAKARAVIGDTPIALDHEACARFLSLARLLTEQGFRVTEIYSDFALPEEQEDLDWLKEHAPDIQFCATNHYACRMARSARDEENRQQAAGVSGDNETDAESVSGVKKEFIPALAIGQKSAYFTGTDHFVNLLEYNGLWGFHGLEKLAELMIDAYEHPSDVESIISVKAWGCHG